MRRLLPLPLLALFVLPSAASAATVSVSDKVLTYQADPGQRSALDVTYGADSIGRTIVMTEAEEPLTAGTGCTQITALRVSCSESYSDKNGDRVYNFWNITYKLGDGNDSLKHYSTIEQPVTIYGEEGNDNVNGGENSLAIVGMPRLYDLIEGGPGDDTIDGQAGNNRLNGGPGEDDISGGPNNDLLNGDEGADQLDGGPGTDELTGGPGNDSMLARDSGSSFSFADVFIGGPGSDTVDFGSTSSPVFVTFDNKANDGALNERDNVRSDVENIISGSGNDKLTGSSAANLFRAGGGDDQISGGAGNDKLYGGPGDDKIIGGPGSDSVFGEMGADTMLLKDGARDRANCGGRSEGDRVKRDAVDKISGCKRR